MENYIELHVFLDCFFFKLATKWNENSRSFMTQMIANMKISSLQVYVVML